MAKDNERGNAASGDATDDKSRKMANEPDQKNDGSDDQDAVAHGTKDQSGGKKDKSDGKDRKSDSEKDDDEDGKSDSKDDKDKDKKPKSKKPLIIIAILIVLALIAALVSWLMTRNQESTDDAYTDGNIVAIAPKVSGYVVDLHVTDNQRVKQGDLLLKIDPRDYIAARDQAQAQVGLAQADRKSVV